MKSGLEDYRAPLRLVRQHHADQSSNPASDCAGNDCTLRLRNDPIGFAGIAVSDNGQDTPRDDTADGHRALLGKSVFLFEIHDGQPGKFRNAVRSVEPDPDRIGSNSSQKTDDTPRRAVGFYCNEANVTRTWLLRAGSPEGHEQQTGENAGHYGFKFRAKNAHVRFHESICSGESSRSSVSGFTRRLNVCPHPARPGGGSL